MLYAINNLTSFKAAVQNPWEFTPNVPEEAKASKALFTEWCQKPTTQNCHFSAAEGLDPLRRVNADNPAVTLHGLIADYDAEVTPEMITNLRDKCPTEFVPNWASRTFSGGGRLVWLFEEPLTLGDNKLTKTFLKIVLKKLKLVKLLPGLDIEAFYDVSKYYERGREWVNLGNDTIPTGFTHQWMYEAGNKMRWTNEEGLVIPLPIIHKEIEARFPGRWKGPFEEGVRCSRFWDTDWTPAFNKTAAVLRPTGFQCFSGATGFMTWKMLFGSAFVEKYEAETTGSIISALFFDGRNYWKQEPDGRRWTVLSKEDLRLMLKVKYNLSSFAGKNENASEVDKVTYAIQEQKAVTAAMPFVHFPQGVIRFQGHPYLNISSVECLEPARDKVAWGVNFPWLAEFIDNLFDPAEQKDYFLSWWKHFYQNAYHRTPQSGQAIFIAGDPGVGKTLLSTMILSRSVGGHIDASSYLLGEEKFTSHVVASPVMSVDDTVPASDSKRHTRYSAMIKKIAANRYHTYEEKFQKAGQVTWLGRVVVTCNLDPESVRLLPNVELSLLDKISLFRCAARKQEKKFPSSAELETVISQELPYLLRWLLDWEIPEHCIGSSRFGVKSYHESQLFNAALQTSASYSFLELLSDFLSAYAGGREEGKEYWEGTSTQLLADMTVDERIGGIASKYNPNQIASLLGQLKARGYNLDKVRNATQRVWRIPFNIATTEADHV
jgi:hypothetical protein